MFNAVAKVLANQIISFHLSMNKYLAEIDAE